MHNLERKIAAGGHHYLVAGHFRCKSQVRTLQLQVAFELSSLSEYESKNTAHIRKYDCLVYGYVRLQLHSLRKLNCPYGIYCSLGV